MTTAVTARRGAAGSPGLQSVTAFVADVRRDQRRAAEAAARGEAYRLFVATKARFEQGVGPTIAPLTKAARKEHRDKNKALQALARQVAYHVTSVGGRVEAVIGPATRGNVQTEEGFRRRKNPMSVAMLEALYGGGARVVTREVQAWVAWKLRTRMGEPVVNPKAARPYSKTWHARRQGIARGRRKWKEIPKGMIPRLGRSLSWPGRPWVRLIQAAERANTEHNIKALYAVALAGKRWPRRWWGADGRYAGMVETSRRLL